MWRRTETRDKTFVRSKMADGSPGDRTGPKQMNELTFSAPVKGHSDTKKCSDEPFKGDRMKLSFYTELEASETCEKSDSLGVAANRSAADASATSSRISCEAGSEDSEDRKKRCFDRYDSSESSDSGVAVLSPTESSGCSGSDITEPRSPRSPESGCSTGSESTGSGSGGARMPPWVSEPAPPPRRLAAQPAPVRRPNPPLHRRITSYFNHKMKPQNGIKRESPAAGNEDTKRKCLPKNGVTHDLEEYISLLSRTLSHKVMLEVGAQADAINRKTTTNSSKVPDLIKDNSVVNGIDLSKGGDNKEKSPKMVNGVVENQHSTENGIKDKPKEHLNGLVDRKKQSLDAKKTNFDPSANGRVKINNHDATGRKVPIPACFNDFNSVRIAPAVAVNKSPKKLIAPKPDSTRMNDLVSSTTKLDSRMNGVTCGSNNLSLIVTKPPKKEAPKKATSAQTTKKTNRKSSACIANSKNLTWSKANNLKQQVQQQKQTCANAAKASPMQNVATDNSSAPKMTIPNGIRQVSMTTVNGSLNHLNVPVPNLQNCHQINLAQPCNGTVTSTNLQSFVAVPPNVMLTTLRIPQNGMQPQTINQQNNMNAFNRPNVSVTSPTKINGQFVFPLMQNLNGAVVQIPNLMAKMSNFVLPQSPQMATQRQDHLQNQQAAQILINGTLLKLANTMTSSYTNINKSVTPTSQPIPMVNKNMTGLPTMNMTMQPKPSYTVNYSHPVLVPQPGFIVTSVPNMNVKETWSSSGTNTVSSSQTSCSNHIIHHPTPIVHFSTQTMKSSSVPIAPVKPPDNPIQGTEPPSSTVKEPEPLEASAQKCDIPWLSKTVNNNIVSLDSKLPSRPFSQVSSLSEKIEELKEKAENKMKEDKVEEARKDNKKELRKIEEVARREETIFTQITVLKDVSSNVQNSVIEATFCNATTESSESGIGTDKSIDSPSDSQTSKECDEDSSLSLSISVSSEEVPSSQKSPILKQPKTLRFPPRTVTKPGSDRTSSTDTSTTLTVCLWENCKREFDSDGDLLEHLQATHVETQAGKENYVCLWEACKVRGKPSCSRLWLERHALSHGGNKPFKCIVDSCERRFSTQILLERHVNNHFNEASPNTSSGKKTSEGSAKLIRRNGKKLRYRRQPWSARMFDFFDAGMMEGLAWRLSRSTRWRLGGSCPLREPPGRHTLTLHAALMATRYNAQECRREALMTYYPPHVIEDEWVPEKDVKRIKRVEIAELPAATKVMLYEQFCASYRNTPSPPPVKKTAPAPAVPSRLLPARHCTSSRLLNNLLAKKKAERSSCSATDLPLIYKEEENKVEVSGARKRKMGRRYGGNSFWPCGR